MLGGERLPRHARRRVGGVARAGRQGASSPAATGQGGGGGAAGPISSCSASAERQAACPLSTAWQVESGSLGPGATAGC